MIRRVLVIECPAPLRMADADEIRRRAIRAVGSDYAVLVVSSDTKVYEVGRWLWQRAIRRTRS